MEAFKCDRCGEYYDSDKHEKKHLVIEEERILDFCPDCYKALEQFMKPAVPAWDKVCKTCKHQNTPSSHHPCYSCSLRFPTFDNWEAMDGGED